MKITKSGLQTLEINGKKFDFRFRHLDLRTIGDKDMVCDHCPLCEVCMNIPDPRYFINPKKFDRDSINDFCLIPGTELFGSSIREILANLAGKTMTEDELLEYLMKKDWVNKCLQLGFLKRSSNGEIEVTEFDRISLVEKEESLSPEDYNFLQKMVGDCVDDVFWDTMDGAMDLIPVEEDIIRYTKEVVINSFKFKPFTRVSRKDTGKIGLVKEKKPNGILVIFDSSDEQLCNPDDLNIISETENTESPFKPFDLVVSKSNNQWGIVKESTSDEVIINNLTLNGYSEEELYYKPDEIELL